MNPESQPDKDKPRVTNFGKILLFCAGIILSGCSFNNPIRQTSVLDLAIKRPTATVTYNYKAFPVISMTPSNTATEEPTTTPTPTEMPTPTPEQLSLDQINSIREKMGLPKLNPDGSVETQRINGLTIINLMLCPPIEVLPNSSNFKSFLNYLAATFERMTNSSTNSRDNNKDITSLWNKLWTNLGINPDTILSQNEILALSQNEIPKAWIHASGMDEETLRETLNIVADLFLAINTRQLPNLSSNLSEVSIQLIKARYLPDALENSTDYPHTGIGSVSFNQTGSVNPDSIYIAGYSDIREFLNNMSLDENPSSSQGRTFLTVYNTEGNRYVTVKSRIGDNNIFPYQIDNEDMILEIDVTDEDGKIFKLLVNIQRGNVYMNNYITELLDLMHVDDTGAGTGNGTGASTGDGTGASTEGEGDSTPPTAPPPPEGNKPTPVPPIPTEAPPFPTPAHPQ